MNKPIYLSFLFLFICNHTIFSQMKMSCYETYQLEVNQAIKDYQFEKALDFLDAASVCRDKPENVDIEKMMDEVRTMKENVLKEARDAALLAQEEALLAQEEAQAAQRKSEAGRLAFLTQQEVNRGNFNEAIKLGYVAYNLIKDNPSLAVKKAFGNAAYHFSLKEKNDFKSGISSSVFSLKNNKILAVANHQLLIWNLTSDSIQTILYSDKINTAIFSFDGKMILTSSGKKAQLREASGKLIREFEGHLERVSTAIFSPDNQYVATCSRDQSIRIWDVNFGNLVAVCEGHQANIKSIQFSPNGKKILSLSFDKTVRIWDLKGKPITKIEGDGVYFNTASFSPKGDFFATGSVDNSLNLWDLNGNSILTLTGHQDIVRHIAFAPDSLHFVSCSSDSTAILWNVRGEIINVLEDHVDEVTTASFSPDGKYFLTTSKDNTSKMYDLKGNFLMNLNHHRAAVNQAVFSPDGKQIVTCSEDQSIAICQTPNTILSQMKEAPFPYFLEEEKEKFGLKEIDFDLKKPNENEIRE